MESNDLVQRLCEDALVEVGEERDIETAGPFACAAGAPFARPCCHDLLRSALLLKQVFNLGAGKMMVCQKALSLSSLSDQQRWLWTPNKHSTSSGLHMELNTQMSTTIWVQINNWI